MKKVIAMCCVFIFSVIAVATHSFISEQELDEQSSQVTIGHDVRSRSEINHNQQTLQIMSAYEIEYGHSFALASSELENMLYGIWLVEDEIFGYDNTTRVQGDGLRGNIIIFHEEFFAVRGTPWHSPVFAYYTSLVEDMASDPFLNLTALYDISPKNEGIVIIAMNAEPSRVFGPAFSDTQLKLIIVDDMLIMESQSAYFILIRIGEIH
jgi:hypothetical protein